MSLKLKTLFLSSFHISLSPSHHTHTLLVFVVFVSTFSIVTSNKKYVNLNNAIKSTGVSIKELKVHYIFRVSPTYVSTLKVWNSAPLHSYIVIIQSQNFKSTSPLCDPFSIQFCYVVDKSILQSATAAVISLKY